MYSWMWLKKSIINWNFFPLIIYFLLARAIDARLVNDKLIHVVSWKKMKNNIQHHDFKIIWEIVSLMKLSSMLISRSQNGITMPKLCSCMKIRTRQNNAIPSLKWVILSSGAKAKGRDSDAKASHQWWVTIRECGANGQMDGKTDGWMDRQITGGQRKSNFLISL